MDYLDPKKERAEMIRLIIGYVLIGVAILFSTLILLYTAYGYGIDKEGEVIQSGLVFVSSRPDNSQIYLNGKLYKSATNTQMNLPAGQYTTEIKRDGYDTWKRIITVEGGGVHHFDYPKLFPTQLSTTLVKDYAAAPSLATQSPDRKWMLVQQSMSPLLYDLYDVSDPQKITQNVSTLTLPETLLTNPRTGTQAMSLVEWSTDNRHVMLKHDYQTDAGVTASEYVMVDRQDPTDSVNLTTVLKLNPNQQIQLLDKKFNSFYVLDTVTHQLSTTTANSNGMLTPLLEKVLAYKSYGSKQILYITDADAPAGQVFSMLRDNGQTYKMREHSAAGPYLIDMAQYSGDWYIVVGSGSDNKIYIYKNPQLIRKASLTAVLVPVQIMRLNGPTKVSFSSNTELVMAQNGTNIVTYNAETDKGYRFTPANTIDLPATTASWMDGQRITYISNGKVVVFDYDNINLRSLSAASPNYQPFFDRDYDTLYTLKPSADNPATMQLTATSLLTPADQ